MKVSAMFYVAIATVLLVLLTVMVTMDVTFTWVFYTMCLGQVMVVVMVYKVLRDYCKTDKTFEHFYEDNPVNYRK